MTKIINKQKNLLLYREEITLEMKSPSNPSFEQIKDAVGGDKELIVIKKVHSNFGKHSFIVDVVVYDSAKDKESVEIIPQKIRRKIAEEAKKAAVPAA